MSHDPHPMHSIHHFTFQSGSILISPSCLFQSPQHILYIPIWFYSNPSPIIPHIYGLLKVLFVDLCFQTYSAVIFSASYSYYLHLYLCYNGFVYLPIFQVYHRSTIISIQSMFHIIFKSYSLTR